VGAQLELFMLFLRRCTRLGIFLTSLSILIGLSTAASAATVTAPATSTSGPALTGSLTIDDAIDPGNLVITLTLDATRGDIRGFLAHVSDESLLGGLEIVGYKNRASQFKEDHVGKSVKAKGLGQSGSACPCDLGVNFPAQTGTTVTFTLSHKTQDLTLALFYGQDFAFKASGIRFQSTSGKSKGVQHALLQGTVPNPIPEPTTAILMAIGLGGLSYAGRERKA